MDDFPLSASFLQRYRLRARKRTRAAQVGAHLVRRKGASLEFRDHALYAPGDDIRHVDWRTSARLGRGEDLGGGRTNPALLADLFESVLGAICLDGGFDAGRDFVLRHLGDDLNRTRDLEEIAEYYKTRLQEFFQASLQRPPRYRIVSTSGPAHALLFEVEVLMENEVLASGQGRSRKQAEQEAARVAFDRLGQR